MLRDLNFALMNRKSYFTSKHRGKKESVYRNIHTNDLRLQLHVLHTAAYLNKTKRCSREMSHSNKSNIVGLTEAWKRKQFGKINHSKTDNREYRTTRWHCVWFVVKISSFTPNNPLLLSPLFSHLGQKAWPNCQQGNI